MGLSPCCRKNDNDIISIENPSKEVYQFDNIDLKNNNQKESNKEEENDSNDYNMSDSPSSNNSNPHSNRGEENKNGKHKSFDRTNNKKDKKFKDLSDTPPLANSSLNKENDNSNIILKQGSDKRDFSNENELSSPNLNTFRRSKNIKNTTQTNQMTERNIDLFNVNKNKITQRSSIIPLPEDIVDTITLKISSFTLSKSSAFELYNYSYYKPEIIIYYDKKHIFHLSASQIDHIPNTDFRYPILSKESTITLISNNFLEDHDKYKTITIQVNQSKLIQNPIILGTIYIPIFLLLKDNFTNNVMIYSQHKYIIGSILIEKHLYCNQIEKNIALKDYSKNDSRDKSDAIIDYRLEYLQLSYYNINPLLCEFFIKEIGIVKKENEYEWRVSLKGAKQRDLIKLIETIDFEKENTLNLFDELNKAIVSNKQPIIYTLLVKLCTSFRNNIDSFINIIQTDNGKNFYNIPSLLFKSENYLSARVFFSLYYLLIEYIKSKSYNKLKEDSDITSPLSHGYITQFLIDSMTLINTRNLTQNNKKEILNEQFRYINEILIIISQSINILLQTNLINESNELLTIEDQQRILSNAYNSAVKIIFRFDSFITLSKLPLIISNSETMNLITSFLVKSFKLVENAHNNYYCAEDKPKKILDTIEANLINGIASFNGLLSFLSSVADNYSHYSLILINVFHIMISLCKSASSLNKDKIIRKLINFIKISIIIDSFDRYRFNKSESCYPLIEAFYSILAYISDISIVKSNESSLSNQEFLLLVIEMKKRFVKKEDHSKLSFDLLRIFSRLSANLSRNQIECGKIWKESYFFQSMIDYLCSFTLDKTKHEIKNNAQKERNTILDELSELLKNIVITMTNITMKNKDLNNYMMDHIVSKGISKTAFINRLKKIIDEMFSLGYLNNELKSVIDFFTLNFLNNSDSSIE